MAIVDMGSVAGYSNYAGYFLENMGNGDIAVLSEKRLGYRKRLAHRSDDSVYLSVSGYKILWSQSDLRQFFRNNASSQLSKTKAVAKDAVKEEKFVLIDLYRETITEDMTRTDINDYIIDDGANEEYVKDYIRIVPASALITPDLKIALVF